MKIVNCIIVCAFSSFTLAHGHAFDADTFCKRINASILIDDYQTACDEGRLAMQHHPRDPSIAAAYIAALAKGGTEKEMYKAWLHYKELVDDPYSDRGLIETLGWSVIEKGSKSSSPLVRAMAVLGAHYGQDAKGVRIIQRSLRDYNALVRDIAIQVSAEMRDERIKREVLSLFKTEEAWPNKLNVVRTLGKMKNKEAMKPLVALIESSATTAELKAAAIASITEIQETITRKDVVALSASSRAGFRQLACEAVAAFDRDEDLDRVAMLLNDTNADVRVSAIRALGALRPKEVGGVDVPTLISPLVNDSIEKVAITASWLMMQYHPDRGQQLMEPWLSHKREEVRIFASAALAASGRYGFPLVTRVFYSSKDSYVRMNLAIAMVSQRKDVEFACMALREGLSTNKDRWMWREECHFRAIAPSTVKRNASIPQLPEATDMMVRLEVLNILAIMKDPYAQESIRDFLRERSWGISGTASATLLTEGDDAAVDLVEALLNDSDKTVKVQAALILSLWGSGERALDILKEAYPTADRDLKERILEGLGRVGGTETVPFLVDALADPHPTLRIVAAASLLKALYN